jgi:hypothetical protein
VKRIAATLLVLTLTACGGTPGEPDSDPQAGANRPAEATSPAAPTQAPTTEPPSPSPSPTPTDDGVLSFGESITYEDGVTLTVSAPTPYTPSEYAAGAENATAAVAFDVTIVNGTQSNFDPSLFSTTLQSANVEGSEIYDSENGLEGSPSTTLLPGREAKFRIAYGVTNPADLVLEVSPSFEHDNAIYATAP